MLGIATVPIVAAVATLDPEVAAKYKALKQPFYVHLALAASAATQDEIQRRLEAEGIPVRVRDHGYCKSIYATDPDGLVVEFTSDPPDADRIAARQRASASGRACSSPPTPGACACARSRPTTTFPSCRASSTCGRP